MCARLAASNAGDPLLNVAGKPRRAYMPSHSLQQVALPLGPARPHYAVSFGLTIVDDDATRAEGVTFLPPGKKWLALALACVGVSSVGLKVGSDEEPTREEAAMATLVRDALRHGGGGRGDEAVVLLPAVDKLFERWAAGNSSSSGRGGGGGSGGGGGDDASDGAAWPSVGEAAGALSEGLRAVADQSFPALPPARTAAARAGSISSQDAAAAAAAAPAGDGSSNGGGGGEVSAAKFLFSGCEQDADAKPVRARRMQPLPAPYPSTPTPTPSAAAAAATVAGTATAGGTTAAAASTSNKQSADGDGTNWWVASSTGK